MADYYDDLSAYYKLFYLDWDASVLRQAQALDSVIREFGREDSTTVLDAACGIGTQTIGLAQLGYRLTASDLSPSEIERAKQEANARNLDIEFKVADMRQVWDNFHRQFDVVIACDNSIPHLLDEDQILTAFKQFYRCTQPGGVCLVSVRDYAQLERPDGRKKFYPRTVHETENGQVVLFDVWAFDGDTYEITTYMVEDTGDAVAARVFRGGKYYCVEIPALDRLFYDAGFREVVTLKDRFFQPLIVGKR